MKNQSNSDIKNGFITFDTLFSTLAILLILMYGLNIITYLKSNIEKSSEKQTSFDRLYILSEYFIKQKMTTKQDGINFENWIDEQEFSEEYKGVNIGFEQIGETCIYRIVAFGNQKEIKKLYFCS